MYTLAYAKKIDGRPLEFLKLDKNIEGFYFENRQFYVAKRENCLRCYEVSGKAILLTFTAENKRNAQTCLEMFADVLSNGNFRRVSELCGKSGRTSPLGRFGRLYDAVLKAEKDVVLSK